MYSRFEKPTADHHRRAWLTSTWKAYMIVVTPPNRTLLRVLSTLQVVFNALFKRTSQSAKFATRK
jgi:hypothetical protein